MSFFKYIIFSTILAFPFIANAEVINTALQPKNIQFNGEQPVYKMGTIIQDGKVIEYKKCQYKNPNYPDKPAADSSIPYCK